MSIQFKSIVFISVKSTSLIDFRGPLINSLYRQGIIVYALAPDYNSKNRLDVKELGAIPLDISFSRNSINPFCIIRDTFLLSRLLKQLKPDACFNYFINPVIFGTFAAWLAGIPKRFVMIEGLGSIFTQSERTYVFKQWILKKIVVALYYFSLKLASKVIFLNKDDLFEFAELKLVNKQKSFLLGPIGVDLNFWKFEPQSLKPIRFIFVGRLILEKGIFYFLEAALKIKEKFPGCEFVVLGDIEQEKNSISQEYLINLVNKGIIIWPGHVEVKPWLEKSSVFVLPSFYREGVPRSIQEAMAVGRPIITTNAPGCKDVVLDSVNGFLIPTHNSKLLANSMLKFIDNPGLIQKMGNESRRLAELNLDVHKINFRLLDLFKIS